MKISKHKYSNYTLADFLQDESFIDWVLNDKPVSNPWFDRLNNDESIVRHALQAETLIRKIKPLKPVFDDSRVERLKLRIDESIDKKESSLDSRQLSSKSYNYYYGVSVAACIAFIIILTFFLLPGNLSNGNFESQTITWVKKSTKDGQRLTLFLTDGSKIKLNSRSEIQYQQSFNENEVRLIKLKGEAFFEVAEDSTRPFRVYAGSTITEALGTSFNIKSEVNQTGISLVTGKVKVSDLQTSKRNEILIPGNKLLVISDSWKSISEFDFDEEIAWKDEVLVFKNADSQEVFSRLSKWFGVKFNLSEYDNQITWNYTGKFKNQTLKSVLTSIGYSEKFEFKIDDKEIIIKPMENK
ncbi:FecR family protein [Marinigracilibium pacificum]|uniref:DUF4974 domain-containing protein n=1 Tax=Marinigracilibium pacificum TaxID=2729599 RepID=A0A848J301_9BACT|nr:FecR family protein [Marinigracilibium pacificum]NMM47552.1 DUF4974 domain-containing protein [Marinigracilibium pacificum]